MADIIKKEPLIRIAKRAERSNKQKLIIRLLSVLLAICAGGIFILILGKDPFSYYAKMVKGAFIGSDFPIRSKLSEINFLVSSIF